MGAASKSSRHVTVPDRPGALAKTFWDLAGEEPDSASPIDVARCAARALEGLERTDRGAHATASTLTFLLRLDGDRIYAAPEQVRGERTSQRSLVFTIGALVFEKLTGQHPFGARPGRAATDDAVDRHVPPELRAALDTAMAPFPADRWSSLRSLRSELERIVEHERSQVVAMPRARRRSTPPPCPGSAVRRVTGSRAVTLPTDPENANRIAAGSGARPAPTRPAPEPPLVDVSLLEDRPLGGIVRSVALLLTGAAMALVAVWLLQRPGAAIADEPAAAPEPVALPEIVVDLGDGPAAAPADPEPADVAPAEADAPVPAEADAPVAVPEPAIDADPAAEFSPDLAGDTALAAMRDCFSEQRIRRGVELGISLRFAAVDGLSSRVYFAPAQPIDNAERQCIRERLTGLSAGAAPERDATVSYTFWVGPDSERFRAGKPR